MKKIYSIICTILFCGTILAQSADPQITRKITTISKSINSVVSSSIVVPQQQLYGQMTVLTSITGLSNVYSSSRLEYRNGSLAIPVSVLSPFAQQLSNGYLFINSDTQEEVMEMVLQWNVRLQLND